jgi:hypothetical protein
MEEAKIRDLLERYWRAETAVEEERALAAFFRQPQIPADLEAVRSLFEWREEEAEVKPGADFDRRILERIAGMEGAGGKVVPAFSIRFAAAAAIILCLGVGLLIPAISPGPGASGTAVVSGTAGGEKMHIIEKDTYTDPNQALVAVRRALLVASVRLNEGKHITQKNITRLHDSWQAATGD